MLSVELCWFYRVAVPKRCEDACNLHHDECSDDSESSKDAHLCHAADGDLNFHELLRRGTSLHRRCLKLLMNGVPTSLARQAISRQFGLVDNVGTDAADSETFLKPLFTPERTGGSGALGLLHQCGCCSEVRMQHV